MTDLRKNKPPPPPPRPISKKGGGVIARNSNDWFNFKRGWESNTTTVTRLRPDGIVGDHEPLTSGSGSKLVSSVSTQTTPSLCLGHWPTLRENVYQFPTYNPSWTPATILLLMECLCSMMSDVRTLVTSLTGPGSHRFIEILIIVSSMTMCQKNWGEINDFIIVP